MGCKGEPFITVGQNGRWYFHKPFANHITLLEVVSSLVQLARFNGHGKLVGGHVYSVGQHSIKVSYLTESLDGLMHDGHECIIGDQSTPLKKFYDLVGFDFKAAVDHPAAKRFSQLFGTSWPLPPEVKRADSIMCLIEAHYLLPNKGKDIWLGPEHDEIKDQVAELIETRPDLRPEPWTPYETAGRFMARYRELQGR